LLIPERLYGREREIETLLASFTASWITRRRNWYSYPAIGIGKSSVVNELPQGAGSIARAYASGKFDQYKREFPTHPGPSLQSLMCSL